MRRHESLAVIAHERQQVGALFRGELDLADTEEEDRVVVVQVVRQELLAGGDTGAGLECDSVLGNRLGVGSDERVVSARFVTKPLDRR
jgi:hypothetical protein